jgi:biotin carboxyl carrier protein
MKMEHAIRAPDDGIVTAVHVHVGDQVDVGALLVVIEPSSPD